MSDSEAAEGRSGGLYIPGALTWSSYTKPEVAKPAGPVAIGEAVKTQVVRLRLDNSPYEDVSAEVDADTDTVMVTIGCQTHPIQRWRRIGARLIRRNQTSDEKEAARLTKGLDLTLDRIEAELRKRAK